MSQGTTSVVPQRNRLRSVILSGARLGPRRVKVAMGKAERRICCPGMNLPTSPAHQANRTMRGLRTSSIGNVCISRSTLAISAPQSAGWLRVHWHSSVKRM
jgi:hypothetical protein